MKCLDKGPEDCSRCPHPKCSENWDELKEVLNQLPTKKVYDKDNFLFAISQPPMDHICDLISEAIYEALDGGTFSIELAKQFIIDVVKETPDSAVNKFKEIENE